MPRVPTYGAQQVAPESLPGDATLRSNLGAADIQARQSGAMQDAAQHLGQTATDGAVALQRQQNADETFRAETALKNDYVNFQQQIENRKGQNAWGATQDASKWWAENVQKHADALQNPVARQVFTQRASELRSQSLGTIAAYEARQRQQSLTDSASSSIVSSTNMAAANATNPVVVNQTKGDVLAQVDTLAKLQGWTPEIKQAEEAKYLTNFHEQIIQTLADRNPDAAKIYYEANKGEIAGVKQAEIDKTLEQAGLAQTAQTAADHVMARGLDESGALAYVRGNYTGAEQTAAVREVRSRFAERQQELSQNESNAADRAYQLYAQTGKL